MKHLFSYTAATMLICGAVATLHSEPHKSKATEVILSAAAQAEITSVEAEINQIEANALARSGEPSLDRAQQLILLGKLLFYDRNLSVGRNEACAFCHMPETGFTGPVSALNQTTVSYPGSIRTRFGGRNPQTHTYPSFSPVLHYNAAQGDLVGGAFWDMRATGLRLNSPLAEQAQGPPLNPVEMGMIDAACLVYRASQRPYKPQAERLWSAQAFAIRWPRDVGTRCDQPGPAPGSDPLPVHLAPVDRGIAQSTFDRIAQTIAAYEGSDEVNSFSSKYDYVMAGKAKFTARNNLAIRSFAAKPRIATNVTVMEVRAKSLCSPISLHPTWVCRQIAGYRSTRKTPQTISHIPPTPLAAASSTLVWAAFSKVLGIL